MMLNKILSVFALFCFMSTANANYTYEANQSLFNLVNEQNTTNMAAGDDQVSAAFDLGFTFTFYGQDFTSARMATNGCLHFKTTGSYCNDYTPDPLPEITYTLYPFWTDLIRDNNSKVLAKNFSDKTVFGWYDLREYNRSGSDNSFEVILWNSNDTFEFRYGALDIIDHDVLIGEQGSASELYTYLFHDECSTGTTNVVGTCVNTNWNDTSFNTLLENGGSLYGLGTGNAIDCSNPLNDSSCSGYDAAYLSQQCGIDSLYATTCTYYWQAYDDLQCTLDAQYAPFCSGYSQEESVAYYVEDEFDYGYTQDDMWYDEEYDEWLDPNDPCFENRCEGFTDEDWYELDVEQFGQEQVDEWFGTEVEFSSDGMVEWETTTMDSYDDVDVLMDEYDTVQEEIRIQEELYYEEEYIFEEEYFQMEDEYLDAFVVDYELETYDTLPETFLLYDEFERQEMEEYFEEEINEEEFLEFETIEELDEWFEEEESEETIEELAETIEEEGRDLEDAETIEEEIQDREEDRDVVVAENEDKKQDKKARQLNVVADSIQAASNSMSGTTAGNSIHSTGNTVAAGGTSTVTSSAVTSSSSGQSMSSSPSISEQVSSAAMQTQQVLNMSVGTEMTGSSSIGDNNTAVGNTMSSDNTAVGNTNSSSNIAVGSDTTTTSETTTNTSVASNVGGDNNTAVGTTGGNNNAAVGNTTTDNNVAVGNVEDTNNTAEQVVAQNIKQQQEELEQEQQETGEYADSTELVAYMGYVAGFDAYRQVALPQASDWYEPKAIYANASIPDNNAGFYNMYATSLTGLNEMIKQQPNL